MTGGVAHLYVSNVGFRVLYGKKHNASYNQIIMMIAQYFKGNGKGKMSYGTNFVLRTVFDLRTKLVLRADVQMYGYVILHVFNLTLNIMRHSIYEFKAYHRLTGRF